MMTLFGALSVSVKVSSLSSSASLMSGMLIVPLSSPALMVRVSLVASKSSPFVALPELVS